MNKLLLVSALLAFSSANAFAGHWSVPGNVNYSIVDQTGKLNTGVVSQGGTSSTNSALITQKGVGNASGIGQAGTGAKNSASTLQLGFGNGVVILQD